MTATGTKTGFPDLPIDPLRDQADDNRDLLGLEQHAAALAGFIGMCSTPMTIGGHGLDPGAQRLGIDASKN